MNINKILLSSLIAAVATSSFANTDGQIIIKGEITPNACGVTVGANLVFKDIKLNDDPSKPTKLDGGVVSFSIHCPRASSIIFRINDNQIASGSKDGWEYGLGLHKKNSIGRYKITQATDMMIDGVKGPSQLLMSDPGKAIKSWKATKEINQHFLHVIQKGNGVGREDTTLTSVTGEWLITPTINPANTLDLSEKIELDGSATIEIIYE
ncbi:hypothetical protein ACVBEF_12835 [Glaciimonas sp. GG7]